MLRFTLAVAVAVLLGGGCTMKTHSAPLAAPEFAKADYTVLGKTNHEECGTYIILDWAHLFANQKAVTAAPSGGIESLLIGFISGGNPEESRALYHALDKMPEATHLLAHRAHTTTSGVLIFGRPLFGERCSSVEAHGVKIGERPAEGIRTL